MATIGTINTEVLTTIKFILEGGIVEAVWNYDSETKKMSSEGRDKFEMKLTNANDLLIVIDKWMEWIERFEGVDYVTDIESPNKSEIWTKPNGNIVFNIEIGNLSISEKWKEGDDFIELDPRNGFSVNWNSIKYFLSEQKRYLNMIKLHQ